MRTKFNGILTLLLALVVQISFAQEKVVSGTVSDDSGPLPGVTILKKGTTSGTETDFDGNYSIKANVGDVLVFSFVGMETAEKTVGANNRIDVVLSSDNLLEEVVVTALGISKEARTLGYGTDVVKAEELTKARETNIVNSLQGKVTGVQITNTGGNLGGSSKIIIRGVTSLTAAGNNPLFVVDGIIIQNNQTAGNSRISGNRDFANGASAINPDDVESMNVLKGAAATALYGSRAAAGAIIITTKRGKIGAGPDINVSSSLRFDNLFVTPDYQQEYAQGSDFKFDPASVGFDWGPRITGQSVDAMPVTGEPGTLKAIKNNGIDDFFNTGITRINNVAISDADERGDYRLSFTSQNQTGVVPNAENDRYNFNFNAGKKHNDKLSSRFTIQYSNTNTQGTAVTGANDPNVIGLSSFSSTLDQNLFDPWIDESGNQINKITDPTGGPDGNNPLWTRYENDNLREEDRFIGSFTTTYSPTDYLSFTARAGYDWQDEKIFIENNVGTIGVLRGDFVNTNILRKQTTADIFGNYRTNFTEDLSFDLLVGGNYQGYKFQSESLRGVNLTIPNLFDPGNVEQSIPGRGFAEERSFGVYSQVDLGYKNWATLTLTARNDWSSTLPKANNSFFYPSASLAFVFTDAFNINSDILSFGKLRTSWAQVGNDAGAYQLDFRYFPATTANGQYGLNLTYPFQGSLGFAPTTTVPNANLVPEQQTSIEFGLEMKLFKNRVGIDFSYFNTDNENQILNIPIPQSSGFAAKTVNAGLINNEGFEIALDADIIRSENFRWNAQINYSQVESTVESLTEGADRIVLASAFNSVQVVAIPGEEFQLWGIPFARDEETGRPIINRDTGRREAGEAKAFGSVLPDWTGGFVNTFSYKGFTLSSTIDVKWGGVMKSSTVEALQTGGLVQETVYNREGTFIDTEGVTLTTNPDGSTTAVDNTVPLRNGQDFWTSLNDNSVAEAFIYDASFVKLREVSLSYRLPASFFKSNGFFKSVTLGVEGRNLALLYSKVPHIDPESNLFGSGANGFGIERASLPSTRSVGFNVRLQF